MEGFCRGCLIKYDEPLELLQYTEKNRRLFVYCTALQVKRNDTFPFQLCKECYQNMKIASKFKKLCRTSDKKFKQYLALKENDDNLDLCNFLKNNDNNLIFKFPLNGSSTPINQKNRDDDNVSTCTSIRNFMNDFLHDEEIPDIEARIIREVIEEEADVLDDTLDSHWLHDELSIDSDFRLDFSFSPFSTPRSVNNDRCYTPKKLGEQIEISHQQNYFIAKKISEQAKSSVESYDVSKQLRKGGKFQLDNGKVQLDGNCNKIEEKQDIVQIVSGKDFNNVANTTAQQCIIDQNLERVLEDENNKEFSLSDLLRTPPAHSEKLTAVSPTITNILFGKTPEITDENSTSNNNVGHNIEKFYNIEADIDILKDFFIKDESVDNKETESNEDKIIKQFIESDISDDTKPVVTLKTTDKVALIRSKRKNIYCEKCNKEFQLLKHLKEHLTKVHNRPIKPIKSLLCDLCGKAFRVKRDFIRHKGAHMQENVECSICKLVFNNKSRLQRHMSFHKVETKKTNNKKYVCKTCGANFNSSSNFILHQRRHNKDYVITCEECGKGFYRTSDLKLHMGRHTDEHPYECVHCKKAFKRRDNLNKHMRKHTGKLLKCDFCHQFEYTMNYELRRHFEKSLKCRNIRDSIYIKNEQNMKDIYPYVEVRPVNSSYEFVKPAPVKNEV